MSFERVPGAEGEAGRPVRMPKRACPSDRGVLRSFNTSKFNIKNGLRLRRGVRWAGSSALADDSKGAIGDNSYFCACPRRYP